VIESWCGTPRRRSGRNRSSRSFCNSSATNFGFGLGVAGFEVAEILAGGCSARSVLPRRSGLFFYDGTGGVEDALRGTVVAFEANDFGIGKIAGKS